MKPEVIEIFYLTGVLTVPADPGLFNSVNGEQVYGYPGAVNTKTY